MNEIIMLKKYIFMISKDQKGTAFLISMLFMVLFTLMGTFALMTINMELQIASNEKNYLKEFYVADSGWKEITAWLNTRGIPPAKVNKSFKDDIVKDFGNDGESGMVNDTFSKGSKDGEILGIPYWNKVKYISDSVAAGSGKDYRRFNFKVKSNAGGRQVIEVTISKIYKVGY